MWLLLLHQIPPKPPYFRAKILRRLNQIGALAIKKSAYVLPAGDEAMEDFEWVLREIHKDGGGAWLFRAAAVAGLSDESIRAGFRALREADYRELLAAAGELLERAQAGQTDLEAERRRLERRWNEIRRIDFFGAPGREEMEKLMQNIDRTLRAPASETGAPPLSELRERTWVTRRGIKVDRIASAWLIRRFIDPAARFRFVDPDDYTHAAGELRFDMFEGEFTHEGDLCTFEVLLERCAKADPGLRAIAEVVHDIDLKDSRYQRPEAAGIAQLIGGLAQRHDDDEERLAAGMVLFDALHASH